MIREHTHPPGGICPGCLDTAAERIREMDVWIDGDDVDALFWVLLDYLGPDANLASDYDETVLHEFVAGLEIARKEG